MSEMEPQTERDNVPIVSVEALLRLADWLDAWKRRNPEAWKRIQERRANAEGDGPGESPARK
jgi:hypothetical protein